MARITLQPASILQCIPLLLPQGTAAPRSAPDALAALIHAINTALQLQLVAVEESSISTSSSTNQSPSEDNVLPASWNARSPDFTLKYREPESNQILLVKILKLGNKSQIHGILEQKEETSSLDIITNEYVSPTFFSATDEQERAASDLVHGYVSSDRMAELITKYIKDVLRPLLPDLNYEPREDSSSSLPPSEERTERSRLRDENQTQPPPLHQPYSLPNRQDNPLEVGRSDLDPFANPFAGKSPLQPLVPGGGMYVGPSHPLGR
ncbi:hypothetical protein CPB86DRAFT_373706 [Serendipita vermifera]|nr:hypothetical protein CPB86DRAFT_373706 [Serendipita vermifera]